MAVTNMRAARRLQIHFSDKLHYSAPDFAHEDHVVPCCTVA